MLLATSLPYLELFVMTVLRVMRMAVMENVDDHKSIIAPLIAKELQELVRFAFLMHSFRRRICS